MGSPARDPSFFPDLSWHRGFTLTRDFALPQVELEAGQFRLRDIDPRRRFVLRATHAELGTVITEPMALDAGTSADNLQLVYQQQH